MGRRFSNLTVYMDSQNKLRALRFTFEGNHAFLSTVGDEFLFDEAAFKKIASEERSNLTCLTVAA